MLVDLFQMKRRLGEEDMIVRVSTTQSTDVEVDWRVTEI